jgi:hypothetical protein
MMAMLNGVLSSSISVSTENGLDSFLRRDAARARCRKVEYRFDFTLRSQEDINIAGSSHQKVSLGGLLVEKQGV